MKYIILFLFATLANAEIYIQRVTSPELDQGYMFRFVQNGNVYCWGMPQMLDQAFIPQTWTTVTQAAIDYRWPVMTGDAEAACLNGPTVSRTLTTARFELTPSGTMRQISDAPVGTVCGDAISNNYNGIGWRSVTYNGVTGIGVCG